ncbi:MAG: hypothetical protein AAFU79_14975 [Myxococcota bacterium]
MSSVSFVVLGLAGCSLADLRPTELTAGQLNSEAEQQGREWLDRAIAAQGGPLEATDKKTVSLWLRDDWASDMMRRLATPWDFNRQLIRLDVAVGADDGRVTFAEGDRKDSGFGIQNWVTYQFQGDGDVVFDPLDDPDGAAKFWTPTLAYFPFLAWRIQEADVVRFLGTEKIGGRSLAKVFATWGSLEPQGDVDQYIVYIDTSTGLIAGATYTVRDMMKSIVGTMKYSDYREVEGFKLPFLINGVKELSSDETESHRMVFEKVAFDAVPPATLVPKPAIRAQK